MRNADAKRYISLHRRLENKEGEINELKAQIAELALKLLKNMTNAGMKRCTLDGSTIYVKRTLYASAGGNMPALVAAFKAAAEEDPSLEPMVSETVNGQRLSAWAREYDPENDRAPEEVVALLPEIIRGAIKVTEKYELNVTKG